MRLLAGVTIALLIVLPSHAAPAKWKARSAESSITLRITYLGSPVEAKFGKWSAGIVFDVADLGRSSADVRIETGSFDSQSEDRDEAVQEKDWFDIARFPQAHFVTKAIRQVSPGHYEADASLTIRDVTRDVKLPFTLEIAGNIARMDGAVALIRTDFGVGQGRWAKTNDVGSGVGVTIHLVADRVP